MSGTILVNGEDLWVKVVGTLQQNWAFSQQDDTPGVRVSFLTDTGGVFDEKTFGSTAEAVAGLTRNGFRRFAHAPDLQSFLQAPEPPFRPGSHPNGPIYSSGRFWR